MTSLIVLLVIWMRICLGYSDAAPLISSTHVRFFSGNQATEYGHGSLADGTKLHYNTVDIGTSSTNHQRQRRSTAPTPIPLTHTPSLATPQQYTQHTEESFTIVPATSVKVTDPEKKSSAVKRSPGISSFGFFPDFEAFQGGNYRSPIRGRVRKPNLINAESLAPEGLFLPPLPSAETNHLEDTFATEPQSAKYAAQHPPYFHEFPHKRAVLYLNEEREENGLEPNLLRSIRPFFPFFEIQ